MGNKRDQFIVRIKPEFENNDSFEEYQKVIPEKYLALFKNLWTNYQSLQDILKESNEFVNFGSKFDQTELELFYGFYRSTDCLQQIIRTLFFDTLMIIENVYSPFRINLIEILEKEDLVSVIIRQAGKDPHGEVSVFDRTIAKAYAEDLISGDTWKKESETLEEKFARKRIVNMREDGIDPVQGPR